MKNHGKVIENNLLMKNSDINLAFFVTTISIGTIHLFFRKELAATIRVLPKTAAYTGDGPEGRCARSTYAKFCKDIQEV